MTADYFLDDDCDDLPPEPSWAEQRRQKLAEARTWAGYRYATITRQTGTLVVVVDGFDPVQALEDPSDPDAPRWFTICDAHASCVGHYTLAIAKSHACDPCGWCEECRTAMAARLFGSYFDVADEIYAPQCGGEVVLTLDDLDARYVEEARQAAEKFGLSWPPYLPEAEEYALDHPELRAA